MFRFGFKAMMQFEQLIGKHFIFMSGHSTLSISSTSMKEISTSDLIDELRLLMFMVPRRMTRRIFLLKFPNPMLMFLDMLCQEFCVLSFDRIKHVPFWFQSDDAV